MNICGTWQLRLMSFTIGHFRIIFSLFLKVSLGAHLFIIMKMRFHSHAKLIIINLFWFEWLCRPRFDGEV